MKVQSKNLCELAGVHGKGAYGFDYDYGVRLHKRSGTPYLVIQRFHWQGCEGCIEESITRCSLEDADKIINLIAFIRAGKSVMASGQPPCDEDVADLIAELR